VGGGQTVFAESGLTCAAAVAGSHGAIWAYTARGRASNPAAEDERIYDRSLLASVREHAYGGRKKRTALNRIRKLVAVRTFADWAECGPGFLEVDLVTHCGERAVGSFVHTLVLTDVVSGWTECVALPVREQTLVVEGVSGVRRKLPFPLLGCRERTRRTFGVRLASERAVPRAGRG